MLTVLEGLQSGKSKEKNKDVQSREGVSANGQVPTTLQLPCTNTCIISKYSKSLKAARPFRMRKLNHLRHHSHIYSAKDKVQWKVKN